MASFDMCVLRLCFQDVKYGSYLWHVIYIVLFHFCRIYFFKYDGCFLHVCGSLDIWQPYFTVTYGKKQWLFSTCIWAFVCMYVLGLRCLWFQDVKSHSKSRKSFLTWAVWVGYLARENQNRKKEKSNTRASENRLYRSRIAGNFDTAKSQGATTARTRADGSSLLGLHGHQGDFEEMERTKTHQSKNRKLKEKKGNRKPAKKTGNRKSTKKL